MKLEIFNPFTGYCKTHCLLSCQNFRRFNPFWIIYGSASYTKFLTNHGDAFDIESGIFTCPRAGVYHFSSAATRWNKAAHRMSVEKNNIKVLEFGATASSYGDDDLMSFDFILELQQGDTIRLKVTSGSFYCSSSYPCIFNDNFIRET